MKRGYLSAIVLVVLLLGAGSYILVCSNGDLARAATPVRALVHLRWSANGIPNETANVNPIGASSSAQIAFVSDRGGDLEIHTMNVDGSNLTQLTHNSSRDEGSSWSPDGTKIVFHSDREGHHQLFVMNADGIGQTRLLTSGYWDEWPFWSPDGSKITFARGGDHGDGRWRSEVFVMNADGTNVQRLTYGSGDPAPFAWPSGWSPDGNQILFYWYREGYEQLYIMNADGGNQRKLTTDNYWNAIPTMSPDGTKIAFSSFRDSDYEVYVMNADGTGQTRLTHMPGEDWRPVWSPDGSKILFESERDGRWQLYSMNPDGGEQTRLTDNTANDRGGAWRPAGGGPSIVDEARLDIGMPYSVYRGCPSPYVGCGGPYHGFYYGVCTDLGMDAYNAGVPFNIQNALYQDQLAHPGRYRYGTARNAEDMRRYFNYNQQLIVHSQAYQLGDIAFFDWNGDGLTNHVNVISEVDANGRPLRMVDATGVYAGNPSGRAIEHSWNSYYDQHIQAHGRLGGGLGTLVATNAETLQVLRIEVDSPSVGLRLQDANGKFTSDTYDENLVASNIEAFIPYIPGGTYADLGTGKVITVTQPLSNTTQYFIELTGLGAATYHLDIETLQDGLPTGSQTFTETIAAGDVRGSEVTLSAPGGVITFTATTPTPLPAFGVPDSLILSGLAGSSVQTTFSVAELGGQQPLQNVSVSMTDVTDQIGGEVPGALFSITPSNFTVPAGDSQDVAVQVSLVGLGVGTYQGSVVVTSDNGGTRRVPFTLVIEPHQIYLPLIMKNY